MAISCHIPVIRKDLHITGMILSDCNEVPGVFLEAEGTVLDCAFKMQLVVLCFGSTFHVFWHFIMQARNCTFVDESQSRNGFNDDVASLNIARGDQS